MSDLERFRDHCRAMATAEHRPDCCRCGKSWCCGCVGHPKGKPWGWNSVLWDQFWERHAETCPGNPSAPNCAGCVTDADRAEWSRLADEADAFLNREREESLW